jgi:hypothetical protein
MILTINHAGGLDAGSVSTRNGIVMHTTCVKARYRCSATNPHITPYALPSGGDVGRLHPKPAVHFGLRSQGSMTI